MTRATRSTPPLSTPPRGPRTDPLLSFSSPVSGPGFFYYTNAEVVYFQNEDTQIIPSANVLRPSALSGTDLLPDHGELNQTGASGLVRKLRYNVSGGRAVSPRQRRTRQGHQLTLTSGNTMARLLSVCHSTGQNLPETGPSTQGHWPLIFPGSVSEKRLAPQMGCT